MTFVSGLFAGLVLTAMVMWLRKRWSRPGDDGLTDDQIRAIEEQGTVQLEEPLDLDHIREEETRFWEESWDEPEEF